MSKNIPVHSNTFTLCDGCQNTRRNVVTEHFEIYIHGQKLLVPIGLCAVCRAWRTRRQKKVLTEDGRFGQHPDESFARTWCRGKHNKNGQ